MCLGAENAGDARLGALQPGGLGGRSAQPRTLSAASWCR